MLQPARTFLSSLPDQPRKLFLLFWGCVSLLYLPAWKAGFGADFHGWLQMYYGQGFGDIINRNTAQIHSLYQLTQLQLYALTALFGTHPLPWFLLFTGLHALVATLLCFFSKGLFEDFGLRAARWTALLGALLFLLHPSNTEVVLWKACYHYLIGLLIMLGILHWLRKYLMTGELRPAWLAGILFAAATFTLETFYAIPWMALLMCAAYNMSGVISKERMMGGIKKFFLPQIVMFVLHLVLYRAVYGIWFAHGAYQSTGKASWKILAGRIWSYEYHGFFLGRLLPDSWRAWVYHSLENSDAGAWIMVLLTTAFIIVGLMRYKRWSPRLRLLALLGGWALLVLGIVLHFMLPDLFLVWNDRYLYFTLAFQCMLLAVLIGALITRRKTATVALARLLLLTYLISTSYTVLQWRKGTRIFWAMQEKFRWKDAPVVIFLNIPTYFNGVFLYPSETPESINEHLKIFAHDSMRGKAYDVAGYNMTGPGDGAHVTVLDSLHLKVTLNQWGTWWWQGTRGAGNYENEQYSVNLTDPGHEYLLTLKHAVPGAVILYQQGDEWRVVDMKKGGDQW